MIGRKNVGYYVNTRILGKRNSLLNIIIYNTSIYG